MSRLRLILRVKIHGGKVDEFTALGAAIVSVVQDKCPGTLEYEWYLSGDQAECVLLETFASSEALLAHAGAISEQAYKLFGLCDITDNWLCGCPAPEVLQLMAAFAPKSYLTLYAKG
jgi:quinol monooxygenase YgiN